MNTTKTTETITQTIVTMYANGQIAEGEKLTQWAWTNRYPVTVSGFAQTWQATTETTETEEVEEVASTTEATKEEQKARIKKALSTAIETFMDSLATERFGDKVRSLTINQPRPVKE